LSSLLLTLIEEQKGKAEDEEGLKNIDAVGGNLEVWKWKRKVKRLKEELKFQT